jgi:SAM-dependent methyltransferase
MQGAQLKSHWTWKVFVEQGETFIKVLERRFQQASKEVEAVSRILENQQVPAGGTILDVYCLTGRHVVGLAERGYEVVGVDISPVMIEHAKEFARSRRAQDRTAFVVGDPRSIYRVLKSPQNRFDAILSMYTYLGSYGEKTDEKVLKQLRKLVAPRGMVLLELDNRDYIVRHLQKTSIYDVDNMVYHVESRINVENSSMENTLSLYTRRGNDLEFKTSIEVKHRTYSLHEIISLLDRTGWTYVKSYGNFNLDPPSVDSPSLIVVGSTL